MNFSEMVGMIMFLVGFLMLMLNFDHFLSSLLCLELMVLSIFYLFSFEVFVSSDSFNILFFIVMGVCESCLGLSVLVSFTFSVGSEKMELMSLMKW